MARAYWLTLTLLFFWQLNGLTMFFILTTYISTLNFCALVHGRSTAVAEQSAREHQSKAKFTPDLCICGVVVQTV